MINEYFDSKKFKKLSKSFRRSTDKRKKFFYKAMKKNPKIAEAVRFYRIDEEYSWRSVAGQIGVKYPELDVAMWDDNPEWPSGHQPDGMWLCDSAMKFYNETVDDGWN